MTREEQFNAFWNSYPNKKGKLDARKAFDKAIKMTSLETMLAAIATYVAKKPDWQGYKHPATWLRAGSWDDEWEPQQPKASAPTFRTSADRFATREEYLAYCARKNAAEPSNPDMLARLKQAGVPV
jgi:hypothetical protein